MELVYTPADGGETKHYELFNFDGSGIAMGMYNTDKVSYICYYATIMYIHRCSHPIIVNTNYCNSSEDNNNSVIDCSSLPVGRQSNLSNYYYYSS